MSSFANQYLSRKLIITPHLLNKRSLTETAFCV